MSAACRSREGSIDESTPLGHAHTGGCIVAIIRFTEQDLQRARNPFDSADTTFRLEEADCIGEDCGERIFLAPEDLEKYGCPTSQQPMEPHYHIVVSGQNPVAGPRRFAVFAR